MSRLNNKNNKKSICVRVYNVEIRKYHRRWRGYRWYWKEFPSVEALVTFLLSFRQEKNMLLWREDIPCTFTVDLAKDLTKDQFLLFNKKFSKLVKERTNWYNGMDDKDIFRYSEWAQEWEKVHAGKK